MECNHIGDKSGMVFRHIEEGKRFLNRPGHANTGFNASHTNAPASGLFTLQESQIAEEGPEVVLFCHAQARVRKNLGQPSLDVVVSLFESMQEGSEKFTVEGVRLTEIDYMQLPPGLENT